MPVRNAVVLAALLLVAQAALLGQTAVVFNGKPALEFVSEEGTARIVGGQNWQGYPALVFSAAHFHVIGECFGTITVSYMFVDFNSSADHRRFAERIPSAHGGSVNWENDKKGRERLVIRLAGQTDRLALAVANAKGKPIAPLVLTGELAKLRTWFDDSVADFEETYHRFRKLTEGVR
ncbi:MAG: hypothetical protein MUQ25_16305 [Candidatus Aminicenantes bacterium]|nr:hypothetical protein [Candidatus Aminicenantes bacterium]